MSVLLVRLMAGIPMTAIAFVMAVGFKHLNINFSLGILLTVLFSSIVSALGWFYPEVFMGYRSDDNE